MAPTPAAKSNCHTPSSKSNQTQFTNSKTPNPNTASISHHPQTLTKSKLHSQRRPTNRAPSGSDWPDPRLPGPEGETCIFFADRPRSPLSPDQNGNWCTIMMYGPTGSGRSHTMFGCAKQQGIVYRSLKDILGEENEGRDQSLGVGPFVQVTVLEIYNEELYDLLSTNNSGGGLSLGWSKGSASKVRLEVMGKKAKNATFISGNEAAKISKEIQKVEKRRIVKSTLCNERSSRSHCMIILDVPMVGGQLMLVDMAGSENIEQAGQIGLEAKMQTAKINQGNIALKRVVESIANGDSHVPFRDSKLTMLLQDSFEDDKSKILMILCASPDPKEMHKTISTLEYGAKAKCIVRGPHTPLKDKNGGNEDSSSAVILGSRIAAMDRFIFKLQMENKQREKERNEAHKQLMKKEEEISALRAKLASVGDKRRGDQPEEIELELLNSSDRNGEDNGGIGSHWMEVALPKGCWGFTLTRIRGWRNLWIWIDRWIWLQENKRSLSKIPNIYEEDGSQEVGNNSDLTLWDHTKINTLNHDAFAPIFANKVSLSTVFEEGEEAEEQEEDKENLVDEIAVDSKENYNPLEVSSSDSLEVYVKWEASKEQHKGRFITTLKVVKDATLADLRKLIEIHLGAEKQAFTFLVLGDHPNGAPVPREKEATLQASKLPICNQLRGHLACLHPVKNEYNLEDQQNSCHKAEKIVKAELKLLYTVSEVKAIIGSMIGFSINYQNLACYNIRENFTLELLPHTFQIFVKAWNGKTVVLDVHQKETVLDMKYKIFNKLCIPVKVQSLVFAGKLLENYRDLGSYNIQKKLHSPHGLFARNIGRRMTF
ncbi:P-loop containing nucleoside triphosphate hydrolases superfamily protein [Actinidia rufa]|uniref:P-loop containing nucleoside triphosphate hydrolases superfamily protein n=1 Tax=Actinidia rufa TaxID=165716 RepID=A0A7J0F365_9ERIC|nr:P-loop containing nucleoside triphosphate hydrolases superfamily protein [Actinidia rufa]